MLSTKTLEERFDSIQERIRKAALKAGRKSKEITLVAITKSFPVEIWERAVDIKLTTLGESRIQEAKEKEKIFQKRDKIKLHFIGHLQSNKARKAIEIFDVIQTVDSIKLANHIDHICAEVSKKQSIFIQINMNENNNKYGILGKKATQAAHEISKMKNILLNGIMMIPDRGLTTVELGQIYRKAREIRDNICKNINDQCKNISTGMSSDYEIAIREGSTHIRIGTALFGARPN